MERDDEISVAEDDQEDMSVDSCDCKLLEFLIYCVRTDHCLGVISFRTAARYCKKVNRALYLLFESEGD